MSVIRSYYRDCLYIYAENLLGDTYVVGQYTAFLKEQCVVQGHLTYWNEHIFPMFIQIHAMRESI